MSDQAKTTKPRKASEPRLVLAVPAEIVAEIETFMANISPAMRKTIDAATMMEDGKPQKSNQTAFLAYAVRLALGKGEQTPRTFGSKIDEYVNGIMASNVAAFEANPENWWELTAITRSLLTSPEAGHNPNSVKRWLEENGDRIAAHHTAVGIGTADNHLDRHGNPITATDWNRHAGKARKAMAE